MIYRPPETHRLWDTWLFEDNKKYHLFYLSGLKGQDLTSIGHAVSTDLVHWKTLEPIQSGGDTDNWDAGGTYTGMTIKKDKQYVMFYGGAPAPEHIQRVGIMFSDDLIAWKKYSGNPVLVSGKPYYQAQPNPLLGGLDWRDPCVVWNPEKEEYDCFICARQDPSTVGLGAVIGRAASKDLLHWELKPPVSVLQEFVDTEVPDYFSLDGDHYLLFSTHEGRNIELSTSSRIRPVGTFYLRSMKKYEGYEIPQDPFLIGAGNGRMDNYVGRTIAYGNERMLYHHMVGSRCAWASPKIIKRLSNGSLVLRYWQGLSQLEQGDAEMGFPGILIEEGKQKAFGSWSLENGKLRGMTKNLPSITFLSGWRRDIHLVCTIIPFVQVRAGVVLRYDAKTNRGVGIIIDTKQRRIEIGEIFPGWRGTPGFRAWDTAQGVLESGYPLVLRVFARAEFVDVYLNDRWCFSTNVSGYEDFGQLGYYVENGKVDFTDNRIAYLEPLE